MRNLIFALCFTFGTIAQSLAQTPVDYRINTAYGFSDPKGSENIIVNFPGKTAHEIYTMMAVNAGILYYEPEEVVYGVEDNFISICGNSDDFCRNGNQKWSAKYILKFVIKNGKVLVLCPIVRNLTEKKTSLSSQKLDFMEFINRYWYDRAAGQFVSAEADNMALCESEISTLINQILGIKPLRTIPQNW